MKRQMYSLIKLLSLAIVKFNMSEIYKFEATPSQIILSTC